MFEACVDKPALFDAATPYLDRLRLYSTALQRFATGRQQAFSAYCSLARTPTLPEDFDADISEVDVGFRLLLEIVRDEILRADGPREAWVPVALTLYSGFWGIAHLNTFGIARHLLPAGKRQLCSSMVGHLYACTRDVVRTGVVCCPEPCDFAEPSRYIVPPALSLPQESPEDIRYALYRSAAEIVWEGGELSMPAVAERIGLRSNDFLPYVDVDRPLRNQVEEFLNAEFYRIFREQAAAMPQDSPPYLFGAMPGVAYASIAVIDPLAFQVLSRISTGSIVPIKFDTEMGDLEMGDALRALFSIVEKNIEIGGGPKDPWTLFESTVSLWAVVHGLAMLMSAGALSELPGPQRFALIKSAVDISSAGLVSRLELQLPGASDHCHRIG